MSNFLNFIIMREYFEKVKKAVQETIKDFPLFAKDGLELLRNFVKIHSGCREIAFAVITLLLTIGLFWGAIEAEARDFGGWMTAICIVITILWQISPFYFFPRSYGYGNIEKRREIFCIVSIWLLSVFMWGGICTVFVGFSLFKGDDLKILLFFLFFLFMLLVGLLFYISTVDSYREWLEYEKREQEEAEEAQQKGVRLIYNDGFEAREFIAGHGAIVGYRITPNLAVKVNFVTSDGMHEDRETGVLLRKMSGGELTSEEHALARAMWPEVNALREAAGYKAIALL